MKGRKVIVGVTGGIGAYKEAELVRLLVKEGAVTKVAMTRHATKFITPLTLETLSGSRVVADMWDPETHPLDHITWGSAGAEADAGPGTHFHAVRQRRVSVTPLYVDLTRHATLASVARWLAPA